MFLPFKWYCRGVIILDNIYQVSVGNISLKYPVYNEAIDIRSWSCVK